MTVKFRRSGMYAANGDFGKSYALEGEEILKSDLNYYVHGQIAQDWEFRDFEDYCIQRETFEPGETVFVAGLWERSQVGRKIWTKKWDKELHRSRNFLDFRSGEASTGSIDADFKSEEETNGLWRTSTPKIETPDDLHAAILSVVPELKGALMLIYMSSSGGVLKPDGTPLKTQPNFRADILLADHALVPRMLDLIHTRCWADDRFSYAFVSNAEDGPASILFRSLADQMLKVPTQPDFTGPMLFGGLVQPDRAFTSYGSRPATEDMIPVPTRAERNRAEWRERVARRDLDPIAKRVTESNFQDAVGGLIAQGVSEAKAVSAIQRKFDKSGAVLEDYADIVSPERERMSVLDFRRRYVYRGMPPLGIPCPVRGVSGGMTRATVLWGKEFPAPIILSHSGGTRTKIEFAAFDAPDDLEPFYPAPQVDRAEAIAGHADVVEEWADAALNAARGSVVVRGVYEDFGEPVPEARGWTQEAFNLPYPPASRITAVAGRYEEARVLLSGAQGVGKTAAVAGREGVPGFLHRTRGLVSLLLAPTHEKAAEVAEDYNASRATHRQGPPGFAIRGRAAPNPSVQEEQMCVFAELAQLAGEAGLHVRDVMCKSCPLRHSCGYLQQEERLRALARSDEGVVIFGPHDYGWFGLPGKVLPNIVIWDERPRDHGHEAIEISAEAVNSANHHHPREGIYSPMRDIYPAMRLGTVPDEAVLNAERGYAKRLIKERARDAVSRGNADMFVTDGITDLVKAVKVCETLLLERDPNNPVSYREKDGGFVVNRLKDFAFRNRPLLLLDGTADPRLAQTLFGPLRVRERRVERNAVVRQVIDKSFSKFGFEHEKRLVNDVVQFVEGLGENVAVFSSKSIEDQIIEHRQGEFSTGHFGALRGMNSWEDAKTAVVVGREEPPVEAVNDIARAYSLRSGHPFTPATRLDDTWRGIRMTDEGVMPVQVRTHPDEYGDLILRQIREREVEQAVDRVRLIHNREPKEVWIMSKLALDITVDEVVPWKRLRAEKVEAFLGKYGFVPISGHAAFRLDPGFWKSERTAQHHLRGARPEREVYVGEGQYMDVLWDDGKRLDILGEKAALVPTWEELEKRKIHFPRKLRECNDPAVRMCLSEYGFVPVVRTYSVDFPLEYCARKEETIAFLHKVPESRGLAQKPVKYTLQGFAPNTPGVELYETDLYFLRKRSTLHHVLDEAGIPHKPLPPTTPAEFVADALRVGNRCASLTPKGLVQSGLFSSVQSAHRWLLSLGPIYPPSLLSTEMHDGIPEEHQTVSFGLQKNAKGRPTLMVVTDKRKVPADFYPVFGKPSPAPGDPWFTYNGVKVTSLDRGDHVRSLTITPDECGRVIVGFDPAAEHGVFYRASKLKAAS